MTQGRRPLVHAAALVAALAVAPAAGSQVPGPERLEVLRTEDGPRVLLAGVGVGTPSALAAERLGGAGEVRAFFGGAGPILRTGDLDGVPCGLIAGVSERDRVDVVFLECRGDRAAIQGLAGRFRAALAALPSEERSDGIAFGGTWRVASLTVVPAEGDGWWDRLFGPRELRLTVHR